MTPELIVRVAVPSATVDAVLAFIALAAGLRLRVLRRGEPGGPAHLVLGEPDATDAGATVCPVRPDDRIWPEVLDGRFDPGGAAAELPFDVVSAVGAFLDDTVSAGAPPSALDRHGRLTYAASFAARAGYGGVPIVNRYVDALASVLRARHGLAGEPRWPDGRRAAIALSHDVDQPERYALLQSAWRPWRFRRHPRSYARATVRQVRARIRDAHPGDSWAWRQVADAEARHGFRSTFFVASTPFHSPHGGDVDVRYDVRRSPYRAVMRELDAGGFDMGLHTGYRAWERPAWMAEERQRLQDATGLSIDGNRHHFWNLGPDIAATLRSHEAAGFSHDSSLAFNEHIGFRRSVAIPFWPWDATLGRPLRTLQIPTAIMDGNLFYGSSDVEAGVAAVRETVDEITASGGVGSIDWHIQASVPCTPEYWHWGEAYLAVLEDLAARQDVWVTSHAEIERWWTERAARIAIASESAAA
jgi:hypothetical protein